MESQPASAIDTPEELPLKVVRQQGRILTAKLEVDMQGGELMSGIMVHMCALPALEHFSTLL